MSNRTSQKTVVVSTGGSLQGWIESSSLDPDDLEVFSVAERVLRGDATWTIAGDRIRERRHPTDRDAPIPHEEQNGENVLVKRLWERAISRGYFWLKIPISSLLKSELSAKFADIDFTVVDDSAMANDPALVCRAAAHILAEQIARILAETSGPVVVGTCFGRTLSQTIRWLPSLVTPSEEIERRLTFVGLNTAYLATEFRQSSNYLACKLAEIYGSKDIAVPVEWPKDGTMERVHSAAVNDMSLLVTAAGTTNGYLFRWYKDSTGAPLKYPEGTVGDVGFLPIDGDGKLAKLLPSAAKPINEKLRPLPEYAEFKTLAAKKRVLVILAEHRLPPEWGGDAGPEDKTRVALAILRGRLASHCVLGARLAKRVLEMDATA